MSALPGESAPPTFRVLRLPRWRKEVARVLVEDPDAGIEQSWNLWTAEVLVGLENAEPYERLVDRVQALWPDHARAWCDATVRRFFYTLSRFNVIELVIDQPTTFAEGRYHVRKELGRGGVGIAWLCTDARDMREVVVKRAWDYFAPLERTDALMRQEAKVMAHLDHPSIARSYDTFETDGLLHLVREFAPGEELSRWRGKGVDASARQGLGLSIADIVAHLHERGYLLLDLRPANFFVEPATMRARLIDVGHCKEHAGGRVELGKPRAGRAHGSPGFAAPETIEGQASQATDVWGFGRLYYFIATGQVPKHSERDVDLAQKMKTLGTPEADQHIVLACAAQDVEARPPTMRDVTAMLALRG
jgi:serine/threonine protein kinase